MENRLLGGKKECKLRWDATNIVQVRGDRFDRGAKKEMKVEI